jgi:hypothetical protein
VTLTDGAAATVVGGGAVDFGVDCAAACVDRGGVAAAFVEVGGGEDRATRSVGAGRCGLGAG